MEEPRKPLWLVLEEAIANGDGMYKSYWLAWKARHPEYYEVLGASPYHTFDGLPAYTSSSAKLPTDNPKSIPHDEKVKLPKLKCLRCEAEWTPRHNKPPVQCPKCHSPYWDKDRVQRKNITD